MIESASIARQALVGVGDSALGEWRDHGRGVVHLRRRLSVEEQAAFGIAAVIDVRGTRDERDRLTALLVDAPYLAGLFA
jgi:hypothetical protein